MEAEQREGHPSLLSFGGTNASSKQNACVPFLCCTHHLCLPHVNMLVPVREPTVLGETGLVIDPQVNKAYLHTHKKQNTTENPSKP